LADENETLADTVERLRAQRFPHLDRALVREVLRLHGDPAQANAVALQVTTEIKQHIEKRGS
jgi:hypothetical protein